MIFFIFGMTASFERFAQSGIPHLLAKGLRRDSALWEAPHAFNGVCPYGVRVDYVLGSRTRGGSKPRVRGIGQPMLISNHMRWLGNQFSLT